MGGGQEKEVEEGEVEEVGGGGGYVKEEEEMKVERQQQRATATPTTQRINETAVAKNGQRGEAEPPPTATPPLPPAPIHLLNTRQYTSVYQTVAKVQ